MSCSLVWRRLPHCAHGLREGLILALSLPWSYPSLPHAVTQCFEHYHPEHSHRWFLFLNLLIAPSFAFCA